MQVLWWLVPALVATSLAMVWAAWTGRDRDEPGQESEEARLARMGQALATPTPRRAATPGSTPAETSHGVAVRRSPRPASDLRRAR